ncbi:MAG: helix-turn-helix domain-containing protein [Myxococcales bacterium FL481]|nr:MAG: helix-turn-helix domain-containing protein [Myxococcales bacterium FL481]
MARPSEAVGSARATSVQSVASQVGFASRSAFSRAFKSATGRDPSSFAGRSLACRGPNAPRGRAQPCCRHPEGG